MKKLLFLAILLSAASLHAQVNCSGNGVPCGMTGATSFTANGAVIAGTTSTTALSAVAPGTSGNLLTSNGTVWASAAPAAGVDSITGTANQINASAATGAVTLSTPQNIDTAAGVGFGTVSSGVLTNKTGLFYAGGNSTNGAVIDIAGGAPRVQFKRSGGTQASRSDVANGANLMNIVSQPYSAGFGFDGTEIDSVAEGTWSSGQAPGTNLLIYTRTANSTQNLALTIDSAQAAAFTKTVSTGVAAGTTGLLKFIGTTSGTVSLSVADAAGTYTMKLPTVIGAANTLLTTDGSGQASWTATPTLTSLTAALYNTTTNCADGTATPADCTAAPAGAVIISAAASAVVVNTTAVTANSEILVFEDSSLGTRLSVTCNTGIVRSYAVTARSAGASFTITSSAAPITNPACLNYVILN